ncbi:MAG TPA: Gfo/Idh/MocA family oxidoreductase, partial [Fibrobacteraceae bacterium]|nr:Gfo/Idh/MocA family oxidoreductase [Fibrobacteraceae bacterium]
MKAILVGHGAMGTKHFNRLSALGLSFEAVLDSTEDLNRFTASLPSLSKSDTLVVIASPASTHASHASFFLKQGFSVFIEKPIATSAIEARELLRIKKTSQALFVGHSERYSPGFQLFQKEFPTFLPKTASLHFTRCHPYSPRCRDVNVALDLLTHDLDCFFSLFPNETDDSFDIINRSFRKIKIKRR